MEPRNWLSGASATPPAAPSSPSVGYASGGVPGVSPATNPGPHWFHKIAEELRGVIVAGGVTPSDSSLTQMMTALTALFGGVTALRSGGAGTEYGFTVKGISVVFGSVAVPSGSNVGTAAFTFPGGFTFPTTCLAIVGNADKAAAAGWNPVAVNFTSRSISGATMVADSTDPGVAFQTGITVTYVAIGI